MPRRGPSVAHPLGLAALYFHLSRASFQLFFFVVTYKIHGGNLPQANAVLM